MLLNVNLVSVVTMFFARLITVCNQSFTINIIVRTCLPFDYNIVTFSLFIYSKALAHFWPLWNHLDYFKMDVWASWSFIILRHFDCLYYKIMCVLLKKEEVFLGWTFSLPINSSDQLGIIAKSTWFCCSSIYTSPKLALTKLVFIYWLSVICRSVVALWSVCCFAVVLHTSFISLA